MNRELDPGRRLLLLRYLLDELEADECAALEGRLLAEQDLQQDLDLAEEELADLYAEGQLDSQQVLLLENKFGGRPQWEERVALARAVHQVEAELVKGRAQERDYRPKWFFVFGGPLLAVASLVAVLAFWLTSDQGRKEKASTAALPTPSPVVPSFLVLPSVRKAGANQPDSVVTVPPGAASIEIRFPLERDLYSGYRMRLEAVDTGERLSLGDAFPLRDAGKPELRVSLPSATLRPGRYVMVLEAKEPDGSLTEAGGYTFRVLRK